MPPERRLRLDLPDRAEQALVVVEGHAVNLTHLNKPYFPEGIRKRDLLDYSRAVAPFLVPHLRHRPYTMKRFPDGIGGEPFFQKNAGAGTPAWVHTAEMPTGSGKQDRIRYILCNDTATLLYLVNAGCIDHNVWMSRAATPLAPDFVLLDLDPGPAAAFAAVVKIAQIVGRLLERLDIAGFVKTSGATGLHVWIPVAAGATFAQSAQFAARLLRLAAAAAPELATEVWPVAQRPADRVYLDYRQNAHGKTIPPPYSPRPLAGAPVSCPLHWGELRASLDPSRFNLASVLRRLDRYGDLFAECLPEKKHPALAELARRLEEQVAA